MDGFMLLKKKQWIYDSRISINGISVQIKCTSIVYKVTYHFQSINYLILVRGIKTCCTFITFASSGFNGFDFMYLFRKKRFDNFSLSVIYWFYKIWNC